MLAAVFLGTFETTGGFHRMFIARLRGFGTQTTLKGNGPVSCRVTRQNKTRRGNVMAWTTPTLVEICIGLEINGYLPAEI